MVAVCAELPEERPSGLQRHVRRRRPQLREAPSKVAVLLDDGASLARPRGQKVGEQSLLLVLEVPGEHLFEIGPEDSDARGLTALDGHEDIAEEGLEGGVAG